MYAETLCIISEMAQTIRPVDEVCFVAKRMRIDVEPLRNGHLPDIEHVQARIAEVTHLSSCDHGRCLNQLIEEHFLAGETQSFYE